MLYRLVTITAQVPCPGYTGPPQAGRVPTLLRSWCQGPQKGLEPLWEASRPPGPSNGPLALLIGPTGPVSMGAPLTIRVFCHPGRSSPRGKGFWPELHARPSDDGGFPRRRHRTFARTMVTVPFSGLESWPGHGAWEAWPGHGAWEAWVGLEAYPVRWKGPGLSRGLDPRTELVTGLETRHLSPGPGPENRLMGQGV